MERPTGPLPPIPLNECPHDELAEVVESRKDYAALLVATPPGPQPNSPGTTETTAPRSGKASLGLDGRKNSSIPSLASSVESAMGTGSVSSEESYSMNPEDYNIGLAIGIVNHCVFTGIM